MFRQVARTRHGGDGGCAQDAREERGLPWARQLDPVSVSRRERRAAAHAAWVGGEGYARWAQLPRATARGSVRPQLCP